MLCTANWLHTKPSDYMKKWSDSEHKSVTSAVTTDGVKEEVSEGKYEDWQYGGRTTIETTFIKSGDMLMQKTIVITNKKDKNGNDIDKLACSEFWKEKDSYRRLQNAFYDYMVSHNFKLERGLPKEETNRQHLDLKEFKQITNFENTNFS